MARRYHRREFLKRTAQAAGCAFLCGCTNDWLSSEDYAAPAASKLSPDRTLVTVRGIKDENLKEALHKLLEPLGGMQAFVKKGQTVMLKPNWGFAGPPHFHCCTSNQVISEVAQAALRAGAGRVVVTDNSVSDFEDVMEAMGVRKALSGVDVEIVVVDGDSQYVPTKLPKGKELSETDYLKLALEADVYIALPLAKSHGSAGFTGALKGMMGLIETRKPFHWRYDLHQAIADINTAMRPDLVIMDGLGVMTTEGPRGPGKVVKAGTLIAGTDPVSVDAAGVRLTPLYDKKVDPRRVRHLQAAVSMGIGLMEVSADRRVEVDLRA